MKSGWFVILCLVFLVGLPALPAQSGEKYRIQKGLVVDQTGKPVGQISGTIIRDFKGRIIGRVSGGRIINMRPSSPHSGGYSTQQRRKGFSTQKDKMLRSGSLGKDMGYTLKRDLIVNQRGLPVAKVMAKRYYDSGDRVFGYFAEFDLDGKYHYELKPIGFLGGDKVLDAKGTVIAVLEGDRVLPTIHGKVWTRLSGLGAAAALDMELQGGTRVRELDSYSRFLDERRKTLDQDIETATEEYLERRKKSRDEKIKTFRRAARKATRAAQAEADGLKERSKSQKNNKVFRRQVRSRPSLQFE